MVLTHVQAASWYFVACAEMGIQQMSTSQYEIKSSDDGKSEYGFVLARRAHEQKSYARREGGGSAEASEMTQSESRHTTTTDKAQRLR